MGEGLRERDNWGEEKIGREGEGGETEEEGEKERKKDGVKELKERK